MSQIIEHKINNIQTVESRESSEIIRTKSHQDLLKNQTSNKKNENSESVSPKKTLDSKQKSRNVEDSNNESRKVRDSKQESEDVINERTLRINMDDFTFNVLTINPQSTRFKYGDCNDRLMVQDGPPDGQCFFRSFIVCLRYNMDSTNIGYIPTDDHDMNRLIINLKRIIIDYFDMHGNNIRVDDCKLEHGIIAEHRSVEKWKSKIFNKTYWGGEIEMILLSKIFQIKIKCICRLDSRFNNDYGTEYKNHHEITITLKSNHYKSILFFR